MGDGLEGVGLSLERAERGEPELPHYGLRSAPEMWGPAEYMAEKPLLGRRQLVWSGGDGGGLPQRLHLQGEPEQQSPRKVGVLPDTP